MGTDSHRILSFLPSLAGLLFLACASSSTPVAAPADEAPLAVVARAPALPHPTDYLPAAGLRWLLVVEPVQVLRGLRATAPKVLPKERLLAFEKSAGIQVAHLERAAIGGYDYSTLIVARTREDFAQAARRFEARLSVGPTRQQVSDRVLVAGVHHDTPLGYVAFDAVTSGWVEGDPTPAKAAVLLAGKRLQRSPSALQGAALQLLPHDCQTGHVQLFIAGPLNNELAVDRELPSELLDRILAASITASIVRDQVEVKACVVGDWSDGVQPLRRLVTALSDTGFARLLALEHISSVAMYRSKGELVEVSFAVDGADFLERVYAMVNLELDTLLAGEAPRSATVDATGQNGATTHTVPSGPDPTQ